MIRDLARRNPGEAEAYLDTHHAAWEELAERNPHDAADILEALPEEGAADLLTDLDVDDAGDVLDEMRPEAAADVLEELTAAEAAELVSEMEADQAADVIGVLDAEQRTAVLGLLDPETAADVAELLVYAADTAGGMMTTDFAALPGGISAGEAIEALRRLHDELGSNLLYVYVVDEAERLLGVVSFRDLVFARPGVSLEEVMEPHVVRVRTDTDREQVAELLQRYRLIAMPVVDGEQRLVGIVRFTEAIEAIQAEAGEDIAVMVGAGEEETVFTPIRVSMRRRLPWIAFNLAAGVFIAAVISQFEGTLETYAILAAYMPIVALVAGNSGAQSLAVIIRSMAVGELPSGRSWRAVRREAIIGFIDGLVISVLAALVAAITIGLFQDASTAITPLDMALIVFISVWAAFIVAGFVGAGIPVVLRKLGQDPALASNIFLTMTVDIVAFGGFLVTATLLLP
ncbi:MAG: magnesium transporter [Acidimicrobiia bacterium]|nr:magnesium transporter [Acidimicrobiia bacterium]